jgi:signal transduction histidine kinase
VREWLAGLDARPALGVRARLVLLVVVALAPALLLFLHHTLGQRAALLHEAEDRALHLARIWADNHDGLLREAALLLEVASREPGVSAEQDLACTAALRHLTARTRWAGPLAIVDREGALACSTETRPLAFADLPGDYVAQLFRSYAPEVGEFRTGPDGASFALVGLRRHSAGEAGARALLTAIDLAEIQRRTQREASGAQFNLMVIDRRGTIIARDPAGAGFIGQALGAAHPLMPGVLLTAEGSAQGTGIDGIDRIFAYTQLPQTGAKIAVGIARSDILGEQEREAGRLSLLLAAVAALAIAGAWLIGELSVVRWVAALGRAARAFGRGDLDHRVELPASAGEFARLGAAFDGMASTIAARVTAAKRDEAELRAAKEQSEAASRAKSEFLATMSHELRTPLHAVIGFADILESEPLGPVGAPKYREYVADILRSARHLLALISDILDFVKADAGSIEMSEELVDVASLARAVARLVEPQAASAGVALALAAEGEIVVRGDERRLTQILVNLAENAVKFTPPGGKVTIAAGRRGQAEAEIVVNDTGIGIPAEDLPLMIEPFRQADGGLSRKRDGAGLGLAICHRLVRLHNGTLRLASAPGKGTTATVLLPRVAIDERAVA